MRASKPKTSIFDLNGQSLFFFLCIFNAVYFVFTDFDIRQFLGFGVLGAVLLLQIHNQIELTDTKLRFLFLTVSITLLYFLPISKINKDSFAYIVSMILSCGFVVVSAYHPAMVKKGFRVLQIACICFALSIIIFKISPSLYKRYILPHLSAVTQEEAKIFMKRGYGIPIAGGYTYVNYIFAFAFFISFGFILQTHSSLRQNLYSAVTMLIAIVGMLFLGRRSELIALFISTLFIVVIYRKSIFQSKNMVVFLRIIPILFFAIIFGYIFLSRLNLFSRYTKTFTSLTTYIQTDGWKSFFGGKNDITSGRVQLWDIALKQFKTRPLLGIGWARFEDCIPAAFNAAHGRSNVANVHNDYLQHLCETGIIGTLLIVVPMYLNIHYAKKQTKRIRQLPDQTEYKNEVVLMNVMTLGTQLFFAFLSLIDPCFYQMTFWIFYASSIMILEYTLTTEKTYRNRNMEELQAWRV